MFEDAPTLPPVDTAELAVALASAEDRMRRAASRVAPSGLAEDVYGEWVLVLLERWQRGTTVPRGNADVWLVRVWRHTLCHAYRRVWRACRREVQWAEELEAPLPGQMGLIDLDPAHREVSEALLRGEDPKDVAIRLGVTRQHVYRVRARLIA